MAGRIKYICLLMLVWLPFISWGNDYSSSADSLYRAVEQLVAQRAADHKTYYALLNTHNLVVAQNPQLASDILEKAMKIAVELEDRKAVAHVLTYFGNNYRAIGLYSKALESHLEAYDIAMELDNDTMSIFSLNDAGNIYYDMKQYGEALERYRDALAISQDQGFSYGKSVSLNNIGLVYKRLGIHDSALAYHKRGLKVRETLQDPYFIGHSLIYIGEDYVNLRQYDNAINTLSKALEALQHSHDIALYANALIKMSDVYNARHQVNHTLMLYRQIDSTLTTHNQYLLLSEHKVRMGRLHEQQGDLRKADSLYLQGIAIAKQNNLILQQLDALDKKIQLHIDQREYDQALHYLQAHNETSDKLDQEAYTQRMNLVEAQHKAKQKEKELLALSQVSALQQKALAAQRVKNNALFGIIAILMILGLLIFWAFLQKAKNNKELLTKNAIIQQQKQEIETTFSRLKEAKEEAEKYSHAKTDFVSNLSHEIRTPMNAIVGLTELLLENKYRSKEDTKCLYSIQNSADHLVTILNDVLDLAKVEAGKLTLSMAPFSIARLSENLVYAMKQRINKPVLLSAEVEESVPHWIVGDETRLYQVLSNLISNAIKFTAKGSVKLHISQLFASETSTTLKCKVADTGIGMSENQLKKIFQRFEQASDEIFKHYGGSGLGLNIAQKLIHIHGGSLQVESTPGIGTTFYFVIEFKVAGPQQVPDKNKPMPIPEVDLSKVRILYVEDNEVNRFLAEQMFISKDTVLDYAENGKIAIEMIENNHYDLVLMDIQMPIMDGIETTKWLRQHGNGYASIPIIGFTADVMNGTKTKALRAGMDDVILKPFKKEELFAIISKYTNKEAQSIS